MKQFCFLVNEHVKDHNHSGHKYKTNFMVGQPLSHYKLNLYQTYITRSIEYLIGIKMAEILKNSQAKCL